VIGFEGQKPVIHRMQCALQSPGAAV
jgi:hypothetical protein